MSDLFITCLGIGFILAALIIIIIQGGPRL